MMMNLAFVNMSTFNDAPYAPLLVGSIRKHMPKINLIQLGDRKAATVHGISAIIRGEFDYDENVFPKLFFDALSGIDLPNLSYCDTDMLFAGSIEPLLEDDFDVAVCSRSTNDGSTRLYRVFHPYNAGLILAKNREFWQCCREAIEVFETSSPDLAQYVMGLVVNSGDFKVKFLDGDIYNRSPRDLGDFDKRVKMWHFKGSRKDWMAEWQTAHTK